MVTDRNDDDDGYNDDDHDDDKDLFNRLASL